MPPAEHRGLAGFTPPAAMAEHAGVADHVVAGDEVGEGDTANVGGAALTALDWVKATSSSRCLNQHCGILRVIVRSFLDSFELDKLTAKRCL